ncbi:gsl3522 [Gloeobacter violaceus PCC 7421]|uniref:Gsl3522 protein n=1 Tax=Gloeobacter violaceus (strain ATCC 29082 / PCC 7421) TaxID=251221 RepID=Q7NFK3_GLOVI|nr:gsl3522 [Gloeobacter violaceus PCC 7421]
MTMDLTPQQQLAVKEHLDAVAAILYQNTPPEQLTTLEGIELAVRQHINQAVGPQLALFLSRQLQARLLAMPATSPPASAPSKSPKNKRKSSSSSPAPD